MRRPALPEPRDFGWTLRRVEEAVTTQTTLPDGRLELTIEHAPLAGVTLEMLGWWFQTFDQEVEYRGQRLQAYLLWHPTDHIAVRVVRDASGGIAPGGTIHIQEAFGRDFRHLVDEVVRIHRWDAAGIGFHLDILGRRVFELDHGFTETPAGVQYRSRMRIGMRAGWLRGPFNTLVLPRRFGAERAAAWLRHNVEEVGCFVDFLPELWGDRRIP